MLKPMKMKIAVTVDKFGDEARKKLESYVQQGYEVEYNINGRKYTPDEAREFLISQNPDIIIAGTEKYDAKMLNYCPNLRMISRVGIGLDSVDLDECEKRGITVVNTPDAPSNAVAELTIGQIFNSLRRIQYTDRTIKDGGWERYVGREFSDCNLGIVGYGRVGKILARKTIYLAKNVYINDIDPEQLIKKENRAIISDFENILRECDIVTLHIPLNERNRNLISRRELELMKKDAVLINTSRGGIVNENELYEWLSQNKDFSTVIDVFEQEPYKGKLRELKNCYLTPHLGSCSEKSRYEMEMGAVENVERFLSRDEKC